MTEGSTASEKADGLISNYLVNWFAFLQSRKRDKKK